MTKTAGSYSTIHISQTRIQPPFQPLWAAVSSLGVLMVSFGISRDAFTAQVVQRHPNAELIFSHAPHPVLTQIAEYLDGERISFSTQIDLTGSTPFRRAVYQAVSEIPYRETRTYGQIAAQLGKPQAARAVGAANGANPLPILIPCHRLVGSDGSLRGYGGAGGIKTKEFLLSIERKHLLP